MEGYLQRLTDVVDRYDWAVQGVGADRDAGVPQFAYTVGLTRRQRPEILIAGLPFPVMQDLLNDAASRGEDPEPGSTVVDLLADGYLMRVDALPDSAPLGAARALYGPQAVRAVQLTWPDPDGRYPDDPTYASGPQHVTRPHPRSPHP